MRGRGRWFGWGPGMGWGGWFGWGRGLGMGWGRGNPYPFCRFFPWMPRRWWAWGVSPYGLYQRGTPGAYAPYAAYPGYPAY